jgi:sugar fermentation stimulation protein A
MLSIPRPRVLLPATFLKRPNRFVAHLNYEGHEIIAHVPDPGRLKELLIPGTNALIDDYGPDTDRKLRYSLELVKAETGFWVSVNTQLPNRLMSHLIESRTLDWLKRYHLYKKEITLGTSRIDFLLSQKAYRLSKPLYLEVKSCSLVEPQPNGQRLALFPDAPTVRGARHVAELMQHHCQTGESCCIVFIVQRPDADALSANRATDPVFADTLWQADQCGIPIKACCFELSATESQYIKEIPVVF